MSFDKIRVHPKAYRGKNPKKVEEYIGDARAATVLEDFLNSKHVPGEPQSLTYFDIAQETGLAQSVVERLLSRTIGGHNGITF